MAWLSESSRTLFVHDLTTGKRTAIATSLDAKDNVQAIALSPDGALVGCLTTSAVYLIDANTGKPKVKTGLQGLGIGMGHYDFVFTLDGKAVVVRSGSPGLLVVPTDPERKPVRLPLRDSQETRAMVLFNDSRRVAVADTWGVIRVYDLWTGKRAEEHSRFPSFRGIEMVGDHTAACWSETGVAVTWDIRSGRVLAETSFMPVGAAATIFSRMRFSQAGRFVAVRQEDGKGFIAETATGKQVLQLANPRNESFAGFHGLGTSALDSAHRGDRLMHIRPHPLGRRQASAEFAANLGGC